MDPDLATEIGLRVDSRMGLPDGRTLAYADYYDAEGVPVLRIQGTPGSRLSGGALDEIWTRFGLRAVTADRPGFGHSTRLPGRGFAEVADDLAHLLDHLGLSAVHVMATSGGAPHALALAGRHPTRVRGLSVVAGSAPLTERDQRLMSGLDAACAQLVAEGWDAVHDVLDAQRDAVLRDPLSSLRAAIDGAPVEDHEVLEDPRVQRWVELSLTEALRPGAEGWADETMALFGDWSDLDPSAVSCDVTWWHSAADRNVPLEAVERLVSQLPRCELRQWADAGHLAWMHHEDEVLGELIGH